MSQVVKVEKSLIDDVALDVDTADLFGHLFSCVVDSTVFVHATDLGFYRKCRDIARKDVAVVVHLDLLQFEKILHSVFYLSGSEMGPNAFYKSHG